MKDNLTLEDFRNTKLNLACFVDFEKGMDLNEFNEKFKKDEFLVIDTPNMTKLVSDVNDMIVKSQDNELGLQEREDIVKGLKSLDLSGFDKVVVNVEGESTAFFVKKRTVVEATEIEKSIDENDINKSVLSDYSNPMSFEKTGKEIKEKATEYKTQLDNNLANLTVEIGQVLEESDANPTEEMSYWGANTEIQEKVKNLKRFPWSMSYFSGRGTEISSENGASQKADSKEQAERYAKYNQLLERYVSTMSEIQETTTVINNMEDDTKYKLTLNQLTALKF